jgi:hypothetical protein
MAVVADSSPPIYLSALSDFHFLKELFGSVLIPPAVYREVVEQGHGFPVKGAVEAALGDWLSVRTIHDLRLVTEEGLTQVNQRLLSWRRSVMRRGCSSTIGAASATLAAPGLQSPERLLFTAKPSCVVGYRTSGGNWMLYGSLASG